MLLRITALCVVLSSLFACETETPCTRYADYVCSCHADDPDVDCAAIQQLSESPSQSVSDQCAADLAKLQDEDNADSDVCGV